MQLFPLKTEQEILRKKTVWGSPSGSVGQNILGEAVKNSPEMGSLAASPTLPPPHPTSQSVYLHIPQGSGVPPSLRSSHPDGRSSQGAVGALPWRKDLDILVCQAWAKLRHRIQTTPPLSLACETSTLTENSPPYCNSSITWYFSSEEMTSNLVTKQLVSRWVLPSNEFVPKFGISHYTICQGII